MKKTSLILLCIITIMIFPTTLLSSQIINIPIIKGDATATIQQAINSAKLLKGKDVIIRFQPSTYNLSRTASTAIKYFVSNTTTEQENGDVTKHIGIYLKDMKNVTLDGNGARFILHGEMTAMILDNCENVNLKNFSIDSDNPTVTEMTVTSVSDSSFIAKVHPKSKYRIDNNKLVWIGDGWSFDHGISQTYDPEIKNTWRDYSPQTSASKVEEIEPGILKFNFNSKARAKVGYTFQMRDGIRNEVGGLIVKCKNIHLNNINLHFLGNFSLVGQFTENLSLDNVNFEPESGSGRTNACFADFFHLSGCKGAIKVNNCRFVGAHDDPINVHGTHLKIVNIENNNKITLRFMHGQSYGFEAFFPNDEIEFISQLSLMPKGVNKIKSVDRKSDREIIVTLAKPLTTEQIRLKDSLVVENVTWTPELYVSNCYFAAIPTRGILVSTRKKVVIENNTFYRMGMSAVLIADDAASWYESGYVRDVTIKNNKFINCGEPVICVSPENHKKEGYVHKNIIVEGNMFKLNGTGGVYFRSVDGMRVSNNLFILNNKDVDNKNIISHSDSKNIVIEDNNYEF